MHEKAITMFCLAAATEVTFHIVARQGEELKLSSPYAGVTGSLPTDTPRPTV